MVEVLVLLSLGKSSTCRQWFPKQFYAEEHQQIRQQEDFELGGISKVRKGQNSRWNRELQRRLGTPALWYMLCFTGRFDTGSFTLDDESVDEEELS